MGNQRLKTKWRKKSKTAPEDIDTEDHDLTRKQAEVKAAKFVEKNKQNLYRIEKGKSTRGAIEAKKMEKQGEPSKNELKQIEKLKKQLQAKQVVSKPAQAQPEKALVKKDDLQVFDVWESNIKISKKPELDFLKPVVNPAIIIPTSGESYNPKQKAHQKLLEKVVHTVTEASTTKPVPEAISKKRELKKLQNAQRQTNESKKHSKKISKMSEKEREIYFTNLRNKEIKKAETNFKNFDQMHRSIMNELKRSEARQKRVRELKSKRDALIEEGRIVDYELKISKHKMPVPVDTGILLPGELPNNLKNTASNLATNIRSRFDSIYRRGLIEYKPIGKAQRTSKYKLHNKRSMKDVHIA